MSSSVSERLASEIVTLDNKIKKYREFIKTLAEKKKEKESRLAKMMNKNGVDKIGEIKLEKIKPKPRPKRPTQTQKKQKLQEALQAKGVYDVDPEELWEQFNSN